MSAASRASLIWWVQAVRIFTRIGKLGSPSRSHSAHASSSSFTSQALGALIFASACAMRAWIQVSSRSDWSALDGFFFRASSMKASSTARATPTATEESPT